METSSLEKPRSRKRIYFLGILLAVSVLGLAEALVLSNVLVYRVSVDQVLVSSNPSGDVTVPGGFTETRTYTISTSQPFQGRLSLTILNATTDANGINLNSFEVSIGGVNVVGLPSGGTAVLFAGPQVSITDGIQITVLVHFVGDEDFANRIVPGTVYDFQAVVSQ